MGRYYNGDIEGKFWFGVQASDCADRFGVKFSEPNYINYYYTEEDLDGVCKEIAVIEKALGDTKEKLDKFFDENNGYNEEMLTKAGFPKDRKEQDKLISDYADLKLGKQIRDCIKATGGCNFEAEC